MRHIKNVLRLKHQNHLSLREIARSCGLPASTVGLYLQRAEAAGLGWPLPESLAEPELLARLMMESDPLAASPPAKPLPDWPNRDTTGRTGCADNPPDAPAGIRARAVGA